MTPPFLSGEGSDWETVAKEIIMITTSLTQCQDGKPALPPEDEHLRLFQHISTLITTGEFWEEASKEKKDGDNDAAIVNAVTGRVDVDRIVCAIFTPSHNENTNGTYTPIRSKNNGKVLLDGWETMQDKVDANVHLQDVVDIIQYLLGGDRGPRDVAVALLFIHRRAFPKLASRVRKAVDLWGGALFSLILQYYKDSEFPIKVPQSLFFLRDPQGDLHRDLESYSLKCIPSSHSLNGQRQYYVTPANVVRWVQFIDETYGKIEAIVERNTVDRRRMAVRPLSMADAKELLSAADVLRVLFQTKVLMSAIFSMKGLQEHLDEMFLIASVSSKLPKPGDSQPSISEATDDAADLLEADEDEDAFDSSVNAPGDIPILRYCRTITAWIEAVLAVARHMARLPDAMELLVYRVNTSPAVPTVQPLDVTNFRDRYLDTLTSAEDASEVARVDMFFADRLGLGGKANEKFCGKANKALVHAEAAAMGLICISALGGQSFGEFTRNWVDSALPTSGGMPIAVSKKCCRSCAILMERLNAQLVQALPSGQFVLPGTHATFFPWCPPQGVPLDVLQEMRDQLYDIFDFQARNYGSPLPTTRSSPAMSEASLPELLEKTL